MKWEDFRQSDNVEDRRGDDGGGFSPIGNSFGSAGFNLGGGNLGLGTIVVLGIIGYALGIDPRILMSGAEMVSGGSRQTYSQQLSASPRSTTPPNDQQGKFIAAVVAQNEDVWSEILPAQKNLQFQPPKLVIFNGQTRSACGRAESAMGPFYCPTDQKIYLDTAFFNDMRRKYGGGGDFAYAYVIAHEVAHHIENQLGILTRVQRAKQNGSQQDGNALSVRVELMADCLAGVWAYHANTKWQVLEVGDVEKALATAEAIGDDRLQRAARGVVVPDSFTHGSSEQRKQWLQKGLKTGKIDACNTFAKG